MAVKHLSKNEFDQAVNAGDDVVIVDFFATWCGPCKMLAPVIEKLADAHPEAHFYKVDVDQEPDLASRFGIMSVPTLLYMKAGQLKHKSAGVVSAAVIEAKIKELQ